MGLDDPHLLADRIRGWWSLYMLLAGIVGAVCGGVTVGLTKLTVYYLAEQASMETLSALKHTATLFEDRLTHIDETLKDQKYASQARGRQLDELSKMVGEIATARSAELNAALAQQSKNSESLLLLLQQQPPPPKRR